MDTTEAAPAPASEAGEPSVADAVAAAVAEAAAEETETPEGGEPVEAQPASEQKPPPETPKPDAEAERVKAALRGAARREKQALERERAAKAVSGKADAFDKFVGLLQSDPLAAFQALGVDARKVFQATIDKGDPQPPTPEAQIADLNKWRQEREQREAADAQARNIEAQKAHVQQAVTAAGERFELINAQDEHGLVWDSMVSYFNQHGVAPDPLEIADAVEQHLADKAERALKTKKFSARIAQPATKQPQQPIPGETTIAGNRTTPVPSADDEFPLDDHERTKAVMRSLGLSA